MALLAFIEQDGESGTWSQGNELKCTRKFVALMSSPLDTLRDILTSPLVPKPYMPHPLINKMWVTDVNPQQDEDCPTKWDTEVEYSSLLEKRELDKNPLARPALISWTSADFSRVVMLDANGRPILNAASDLVEDITKESSNWVIKVEKNIVKMPKWVLSYKDAVNSDAVKIENLQFPPDSLKIRRLERSEIQEENDHTFYKLSFELHHNPEGWTTQIPNRGFNEIEEYEVVTGTKDSGGTGLITQVPIIEKRKRKKRILIDGEYPSEPQFLDKQGRLIRDKNGDPKQPLSPSDIVILKKQLEPRLPFRVLPLK
jgi:hypothetical protein